MSEILNDTNFEQFIKDNENVVVDFFAEWCGPCKMLGPLMSEIAEEHEKENKNVKIIKLNVEESPQTAQKFGVMSIPTIIYFKNGEVHDTTIGLMPKDQLNEKIDNLINS